MRSLNRVLKTVKGTSSVMSLQAGAAFSYMAYQSGTQTLEGRTFNDTNSSFQGPCGSRRAGLLDRQCTSITLSPKSR